MKYAEDIKQILDDCFLNWQMLINIVKSEWIVSGDACVSVCVIACVYVTHIVRGVL